MLLSEAIIIGAAKRPMATESYFRYYPDGTPFASCALGAAYEGVTGQPSPAEYDDEEGTLGKFFPVWHEWGRKPSGEKLDLYDIITAMNDSGLYTREGIAAWLAECGY